MTPSNLNNLDYFALFGYFALIAGIAWFALRKRNNSDENQAEGYFLGGRDLSWVVIGASLFASNIGSEHLVGLAGAGAKGDFAAGQFEILAALILILLGWVFVPFYLRSGVYTMPEFLEKRYSSWARGYLSWLSIAAYVMTKISVTIAAGGIIFTSILHIDFWTGAIITVVATGLYTVLGGLRAVVYTDLMQMFILIAGSIAVTWIGMDHAGGWSNMVANTTPGHLSLWRSVNDPDFPWTGILLGAPILGVWYWCTDQFIVQRVLAAKNLDHARYGTIFGGFLKLLPLFIFVLPGVVAYSLYQQSPESIPFPIENGEVVYDAALPTLITYVMPNGIKGLVIAGLLAALMSSLSSVFNSCSTLFTYDIYLKHYPKSSPKRQVYVGQFATAVLVVLGLAWIPLLQVIEGGLFQKLQSIQAYISPPIAVVFLFGLLDKRLNATGAKWALLAGAAVGTLRLIAEINKPELSGLMYQFADFNFLHFAFALFVFCAVVFYVVSYQTAAPVENSLDGLTLQTREGRQPLTGPQKALTLVLILLIAFLWYIFS